MNTLIQTVKMQETRAPPLQEGFKASSVGEPGSPDPKVFHEAQVLHLVSDQNFIKCA